jgi:hypothetical protein
MEVLGGGGKEEADEATGLFVTDLSLPTSHAELDRPKHRALSQTDKIHYAPGSH